MPNKMLIDASHPEETRVVVTRGNRIEEFDFESRDKKQLRGNIYLARVTRVEPSLQAAFIEYGGNRHGFLAFSEIHPDYYQIPVADRQALLKAEAEAADLEEEEDEERERNRGKRRRGGKNRERGGGSGRREQAAGSSDAATSDGSDDVQQGDDAEQRPAADDDATFHDGSQDEDADDAGSVEDGSDGPRTMSAAIATDSVSEALDDAESRSDTKLRDDSEGRGEVEDVPSSSQSGEDEVESVGAEDALEELPNRRRQMRRQYKIQEVIKRRQILLVQVVKEERGNKGAALTTYLSLAGRYSVLMPNTARGGGISRKITSAQDRKRLKDVVEDLDVPDGMGVILRTAGANRTKAEIKRDYEYLMRLWENVRTLTLQSTAPALVYEEGSLIKRSVRDLYNKDIEEIQVSGDEGYREAKDFMRMLMPSHAKMVQPYKDVVPIFARNGIEAQLDRMLQPQVTLKSGGYIIINQTEALVAIDVNSGRSTKEHSIEDTALHTNLEAAEEVARQLRLRDLAGLIVIDFIDMEENRNNRTVEKRLKDHLKNDRARIQVGRISHFGLMEMSRQRIRASVLDSTMKPCPHCGGTGHVRSDSSVALHVVRAIEEFLIKDARSHITVRTPSATALYVLNYKRRNITDLEERFGLTISIEADETLGAQHYAITRGLPVERPVVTVVTAMPEPAPHDPEDDIVYEDEIEDEETVETAPVRTEQPRRDQPRDAAAQTADGDDANRGRKRRRRRRRKGGRDREGGEAHGAVSADAESTSGFAATDLSDDADGEDSSHDMADEVQAQDGAAAIADGERKKRRRGKRGGKRNRKDGDLAEGASEGDDATREAVGPTVAEAVTVEPVAETAAGVAEPEAEAPAKKPRRAPRKAKEAAENAAGEAEPEKAVSKPVKAKPRTRSAKAATPEQEAPAAETPVAEEAPTAAEPVAAEPLVAEPVAPARASRRKATSETPVEPKVVSSVGETVQDDAPKKGGWWQRKGFF